MIVFKMIHTHRRPKWIINNKIGLKFLSWYWNLISASLYLGGASFYTVLYNFLRYIHIIMKKNLWIFLKINVFDIKYHSQYIVRIDLFFANDMINIVVNSFRILSFYWIQHVKLMRTLKKIALLKYWQSNFNAMK